MAAERKQDMQSVAKEFGLKDEEYTKVLSIMGREPNITELGIFSVMWSEHCSYKSTRLHLKKLPTEAPWVICGPGENAGVIDIGDGQAAIFKMESHNHPSFIEPYQGAATGVGGIMRDVFTMGARPVANLNALRFGALNNPRTRHLISGVVAGIGGYGNCMGIPTVAGECNFHPSYNGNILVNAMCVGVAKTDKIFYSAASSIGSPVVYVGAKTGRDGIHGATMASAEFDEDSADKRPTVQVGDPFTEKLVMEACLELMATDAILSIQDMGAAGLTCSSLEMADKGHAGIELNLDNVPQREPNMTAYEMMLSESQERMLMVIKPEKEEQARKIFEKWEVDFAVIGKITDTGRMVLKHGGKVVGDLPVSPLSEQAPLYDRPHTPTAKRENIDAKSLKEPADVNAVLKKLFNDPNLASKRWIWEQYDSQVGNDTIAKSGGDAALVRVNGTKKALAMTSDCTPRYCFADPVEGGKQAVAETWRNITATGATPLAITNCLNFGNPEKPAIMGQIVGCLEGMSEACKALDYPIISGNVSLYNETNGNAILPTPSIGGVGIVKDASKTIGSAFVNEGETIIVIGETKGHIGSSIYLREIEGSEAGSPPPVDLGAERKHGDFVRGLIAEGKVTACHDISDGGLYVAIAEMAMARGIGASLSINSSLPLFSYLFGEDQGRYIVTTENPDAILNKGIAAEVIGMTGSNKLSVNCKEISISELKTQHESVLPDYMAG
ncbi:MAG: phosphoribosylformylglycinamidine synthase [Rickettsiaceae bacterium]|nr:phosphoribosylformylglycinamidine synthase [Rickettsiaceae bacterium]